MTLIAILVLVIFVGFVIFRRRKVVITLTAQEINEMTQAQLKRIDQLLVDSATKGEKMSFPKFIAGLEESNRNESDKNLIAITDNIIREIIIKYADRIPPEEAFIENGEMIVWNEFPGCYERHLQRRYKNLLFRPERRVVLRKEIEEARAKDKREQDIYIAEVRKIAAKLVHTMPPPNEMVSFVGQVQLLIRRAASIGGNLQKEIEILEKASAGVSDIIRKINPQMGDVGKELSDASHMYRYPYMAATAMNPCSFSEDEEVATLLSEDLSTVAFIGLASRSFPDYRPSEADIIAHLDEAVKQGFDKARAEEIIIAWNRIEAVKAQTLS